MAIGWFYRKTKKLGPLRVTASRRGFSVSGGGKGIRFGRSTSGRKRAAVNFGRGLRWSRTRR